MKILKGLSFAIPDLILVQAWSEAHAMRMVVRLDHGSDNEQYEEVLAVYPFGSLPCRWIIWQEAGGVYVQPVNGRSQHYGSVVEALEALTPSKPIAQTHIRATRWPIIP
ncbi:hypothetical protein CCS01_08485 [Rhodopila globiformis]|uniref:Uncharacterized protein n=2 Tax=Rhodopila globiformis TaxID=1071 RepID=A0A2S6NK12_RHOGL|nr:hypothetical protein CCS01_08485 [Rhodopila globiformis]